MFELASASSRVFGRLSLLSVIIFVLLILPVDLRPASAQAVNGATVQNPQVPAKLPSGILSAGSGASGFPLGAGVGEANNAVAGQTQDDFVRVKDGRFVLMGKQVWLKGVNFYPHLAFWANMWQHWNGPEVTADLDKAARLNLNSLRILIPYGASYDWTTADGTGTVNTVMLDELDQVIDQAARRHMRVLLTLFDFYGGFPRTGTAEEAANWRYLDTLVGRYRDDPRVLGWDVHNEPDNYNLWQEGQVKQSQVIDWLGRAVVRIKNQDPNHFVTIGFGSWQSLLQAVTVNSAAVGLIDVVALHVYDPANLAQQVTDIRGSSLSNKGIFLEEFGWPSAPVSTAAGYSEQLQLDRYQSTLEMADRLNLDGAIAWTLSDMTFESIIHLTPEMIQQFGLIRLDGSLKPAGQFFSDYFPLLSSPQYSLNLALPEQVSPAPMLTVRTVDPNQYALYFDETGYGVPTPFKEYWNRMGGLASFGYPISGVLVENGFLVQYFERTLFEFHPEAMNQAGYAALNREDQLKQIVLLGLLGDEWLDKHNQQFAAATPLAGQEFFSLTGHNLGGIFKQFWEANGGLARFGYPRSEEVREVSKTDGKTYLVQYFERARFEFHPEFEGTPYQVELGQLGREQLPAPGTT